MSIPLLIIGAGPFGLAMSAYARGRGIDHVVIGRAMEFWQTNMPKGMHLRSGVDWHLDPLGEETIERYLETRRIEPDRVTPLPLDVYLDYCAWFRRRKGINAVPERVSRLSYVDGASPRFEAELQSGETIVATNVLIALGFGYFKNVPEPYPDLFPRERLTHTSDLVEFSGLVGERVLIIGGRQSAFEYAALIAERGAAGVHLAYRHATPSFERSDWSWVSPIVDKVVANPGWYRGLPADAKEEIMQRMWREGRLKLEPWLAARIADARITLHPFSQVTGCREMPGGELDVTLSDGATLSVDRVILATGYKVDVNRIPLLAEGNILERLDVKNGFPVLDDHLQSSVPGLFFTSMCAAQDFGPIFAFTVSARASALLIGERLLGSLGSAE